MDNIVLGTCVFSEIIQLRKYIYKKIYIFHHLNEENTMDVDFCCSNCPIGHDVTSAYQISVVLPPKLTTNRLSNGRLRWHSVEDASQV